MSMNTKPPHLVPSKIQKILRKCVCPECGEALIFGRWKHYFEYVVLTPDESLQRDCANDRSESLHLQCPRDYGHSIAGILTGVENEMLYDFVTAR